MHSHDIDAGSSLRPKGDRIEREETDAMAYRAAAAGRMDVLGPEGLLGLQRTVGNAGVGSLMEEQGSPVHDVVNSGGGSPLPSQVRTDMESRFGQDFSDVRVHTGSAAHDSARSVNAHAYTVGSNIVFQRDRYDPESSDGRLTLAHELTHVVQQRSGPVDGTDAGGGVRVSDPSDRFEREAVSTAERMMSGPAPVAASPAPAPTPVAQRTEEPAEEEVAQTFVPGDATVQRTEDEEEFES